jgi:hypothetical protein
MKDILKQHITVMPDNYMLLTKQNVVSLHNCRHLIGCHQTSDEVIQASII